MTPDGGRGIGTRTPLPAPGPPLSAPVACIPVPVLTSSELALFPELPDDLRRAAFARPTTSALLSSNLRRLDFQGCVSAFQPVAAYMCCLFWLCAFPFSCSFFPALSVFHTVFPHPLCIPRSFCIRTFPVLTVKCPQFLPENS